jgi:GTPase SAR1 family protein
MDSIQQSSLKSSLLNNRNDENHVKVLVIGDPLIGKSDFITSFIDYGTPYETLMNQNISLQISYTTKTLSNVESRPNEYFKYHIWEISDYDSNRELIRTYINSTQIVILCFNLKNPDSLKSLKYWLDNKTDKVKYVLVGLKSNQCNKINEDVIKDFYKFYSIDYYEIKDFSYGRSPNVVKPFTKFLNDIYPKVNVIIERQNNSIINNIINYCSIL